MSTFVQQSEATYEQISKYVLKTPLIRSTYFSNKLGCNLYFKLENLQRTGSFKARGAITKACSLSEEDIKKGFVTASGGNHGLGVCYAAKVLNTHAHVFLASNVPQYKRDEITRLGGEIHNFGSVWDEANEAAMEFAKQNNMSYIHPFDDDQVILGQSTIALEILQDLPEVDVVVCSIGGGGLISGVAKYLKQKSNGAITVYGVETVGASSMYQSVTQNQIITLEKIDSIAESLGAKRVTERTFDIVKHNVDECVTVTDDEAVSVLLEILQHDKQLVEPAASCSLAALYPRAVTEEGGASTGISERIRGKNVVVLLCGGNFPISKLATYLQ